MIFNYLRLSIITMLFLSISSLSFIGFCADAKHRILHVAKFGSDNNDGSEKMPFLTIAKAASLSRPGDHVVIHNGIYREMILLNTGGQSDALRILYTTAAGEKVTLKGSERINTWIKNADGTWEKQIDSSYFGDFNPFNLYINKDSSFRHLGEVYLDNKPLQEQKAFNQIEKLPYSWATLQENGKTIIAANFGDANPNKKLAEINVRPAVLVAAMPRTNFISVDGISFSQVASPMAEINGEQRGAISLNGSTHWIIRNCTISDCKSVAIAIGQKGHDYPGANYSRPLYNDLSQDISGVGHDVIKHNHIFRCGQAAVFGLLHGTGSEISDNLIEDINVGSDYPAKDIAGIRLAYTVDALICHNLLRRIHGGDDGYGLFLGPLVQNTRISRNVILATSKDCIYVFDSHGPVLIDNNIIYGPGKSTGSGIKLLGAEANVFVQNLFYDCDFTNTAISGRPLATSNFLPHTLVIKQTIPVLPMDDRWFNNLFIKGGMNGQEHCHDCEVDNNVYLDGAAKAPWAEERSKVVFGDAGFKMLNNEKGVAISLNSKIVPMCKLPGLTPDFLGFFALSKQYLEYADGSGVTVDHDFNGLSAKGALLPGGPFYQYPSIKGKTQLLFIY